MVGQLFLEVVSHTPTLSSDLVMVMITSVSGGVAGVELLPLNQRLEVDEISERSTLVIKLIADGGGLGLSLGGGGGL